MAKVLIVEDEETLARNLAESCKGEGFNVLTAGMAKKGWRNFASEHPDLIVLDIMLPKLDGLEPVPHRPARPGDGSHSDHHADGARHRSR